MPIAPRDKWSALNVLSGLKQHRIKRDDISDTICAVPTSAERVGRRKSSAENPIFYQ
jgi:hypothetical protein